MKEESETSSEVLERLSSVHLISPHNHLLSVKQESPPHASSPSPTSVSSISSLSKVTSSTNGNGASLGGIATLPSQVRQMYENVLAAAAVAASHGAFHHPGLTPEQNLILMQEFVGRTGLSSTNSTRSKSSSSDGSNGGSPISLGLSVGKPKAKSGAKPRSPGAGSVASSTGNREKVFVCQICNRSFGYKHVLQNHERTHTGEKPFECRECHKRFTRDHHLKTHMRLHTGEKPYHCNHCDRQFVQVANLRRHLRVHTGEKPYACELCTSRFSDSNQLKAHMLIHKGEKPFQCKKCEGRFRRRHHLMHHKCPKDEANIGKPRRGRKPKAYDGLQILPSPSSLSSSRPGSADELLAHLPLLTSAAAVSSTTSNASTNSFYHLGPKPQHLPPLRSPSHLLSSPTGGLPLTTHHFDERNLAVSKSRRKPRHTNRIIPQAQHSALFNGLANDDVDGMQTQPLNLSISPALTVSKPMPTHLGANSRRTYNSSPGTTDDDVLDLSRSRSDAESEPEPIEEEDDEEEEVSVKDESLDEMMMMHQKSSSFLQNGQNDSFKRHLASFGKHFSSKHINNNNHFAAMQRMPELDEKALLENGNGLSAINLAAFGISQAQLDSFHRKAAGSNGLSVPLMKALTGNDAPVGAEAMVNE